MQNPYNRYQQNKVEKPKPKKKQKRATGGARKRKPTQKSESGQLNVGLILASFIGLGLSFYVFAYTDQFVEQLAKIQVGFTQSKAADSEKSTASGAVEGEKNASLPVGKVSQLKSDANHLTMKNASVYKALRDKRRELEKKERRLAQLEEDLQIQKVEIEKQLKEMKEMRRNISSKLDTKVVADQESIDKLVGVYASMKPQNAAIIISQIDDELAVKVLGKMKKQNAAEILNHVAPKKAQYLSEKFTGLKK